MSYSYGQFPGDFSTPPTPGPVEWPEQKQEHQQLQQHPRQHPQHQEQQAIVSNDLHSPLHSGTFPGTIQLEEPPAIVPSHREQPHVIQLHPAEQQDPSKSMMSSSSSSVPSVIRSGRSKQHQQAQQQTHPYSRPSNPRSSSRGRNSRQQQVQQQHQEHHVHFAPAPVLTRVASGSGQSSARPSPLIPSPTNKMTNFGSSSNSPSYNSQNLPKASPRGMDPPPLPASLYSVRMDTAYDADTNTMTAMLEMPGVRQEHLTLRLSTCSYNGVRQLSKATSERRYGMFQRAFPVPATTRREDVTARLQDGVLTISFKCPDPVDEDEMDVPVICPTTAATITTV
ncbi:hypothetical protein BKA70DRAFT_1275982 [Coprinopsis sp. MPI-PUGE-AT-0042]|nr:hypothetical protein BKA70DRAFT_1275982 [Coprinopsis sp. MPI-PUGE-AT-0042]